MNKKQAKLLALLSLAAFALAFLLNGRLWFRLDLTSGRSNTIAEVSRNLHREITDELRITYFVSARLAASHPLPSAIADLLREYAAHSHGKIRFVQRDPAETALARSVEELGIIPWQVQIIENNEPAAVNVYSGILIEYLDREDVIPLALSLETLEYDLTSRIRSLVRNTSRELGIIAAGAQWPDSFTLLNRALFFAGFRSRLISGGEEIPP